MAHFDVEQLQYCVANPVLMKVHLFYFTKFSRPQHVFGRTGLGHEGEQGVTKVFKTRIRGMLQDYLRGSDMSDLAFSPLFSKEQRAEIHK